MVSPTHKVSNDGGFFRGWRFSDLFHWGRQPEPEADKSKVAEELRQSYPDDAAEIMGFMTNVLRRREVIVERLKKHPELNDHGFFMVLCLMYMETYRGVGYTAGKLIQIIELFATAEISPGTAARKLQKANEIELFVTDKDARDNRRQRYYLNPEMIKIFSEMFGGMIDDVRGESSIATRD